VRFQPNVAVSDPRSQVQAPKLRCGELLQLRRQVFLGDPVAVRRVGDRPGRRVAVVGVRWWWFPPRPPGVVVDFAGCTRRSYSTRLRAGSLADPAVVMCTSSDWRRAPEPDRSASYSSAVGWHHVSSTMDDRRQAVGEAPIGRQDAAHRAGRRDRYRVLVDLRDVGQVRSASTVSLMFWKTMRA
jgi:hypothetical protein